MMPAGRKGYIDFPQCGGEELGMCPAQSTCLTWVPGVSDLTGTELAEQGRYESQDICPVRHRWLRHAGRPSKSGNWASPCDAPGLGNCPLIGEDRKWSAHGQSDAFDPLYGPAVRCKRFRQAGISGLASMYPVSDWSCFAPDHHGYQRACGLIIGQTSMGQLGHQCSHAPGRPILHLFSSSRRPRRVTGKGSGITSSLVLSMLPAIRRVE